MSRVALLSLDAAYGRVYVNGPDKSFAEGLPGAAVNNKKGSYEISLTLEMLRALRKKLGISKLEFAKLCSPQLMNWAMAAGRSEQIVNQMHEKLDRGWRQKFPWTDNRCSQTPPANIPDEQLDINDFLKTRDWPYRKPFDHQQIMASVAVSLDGCAFLCEMGTGKTRAAVEAARWKIDNQHLNHVLIVCPRGVMGTWQREFDQWWSSRNVHLLIDMPVKDRIEIIKRASETDRTVYVVNYDVIAQMQEHIIEFCEAKRVGMVADEMHRIRNPRAQMSEATMNIAKHVKWRIGMSGSPILQGAHDIWSQWYIVDLGITFGANYVQFKREYFDENEYTYELAPKSGTLEAIGTRLRRRGLRYTKNECLDLPPQIWLPPIEVDMAKDQKQAYDEMAEFLIAKLEHRPVSPTLAAKFDLDPETGLPYDDDDRVATAGNQLAMLLRLTQITSGFVPDADGRLFFFKENPKLDALVETIEENIQNHQILIWARYRVDHEQIARRLSKYNPVILRGGVSQKKRDEIEIGFAQGRYRLMIGQPGAGGEGTNFQAASQSNYFSQDYRLDYRQQTESRNHRSGSEIHEKITYQDYACRGTTDLDISAALAAKKSVAEIVVDLKRRLGMVA